MSENGSNSEAMFFRRVYQHLRQRLGLFYQKSYAQCGEDLIVNYIFNALKVARPTYIDIGAHHPFFLSNSYLFYRQGCKGVCIEPDPYLFDRINRARRRDTNLNVGLAAKPGRLKLHVFSSRTLNTFSEEEAKKYMAQGHQVIGEHEIDVLTFEDVVSRYFDRTPDFISLDVEGMDLEILQSIDFSKHQPTVFCIETITYSRVGEGRKLTQIDDIMTANNYMKYADTHINSIYVHQGRWLAQT